MDKATFLEMMDKYIDGTLSGTEQLDFIQMIKKDPTLRAEFDLHKSIRNGIYKSARKDFVADLIQIKNEVNDSDDKIKPLFSRWIIMGIAASFIVVAAALFLLRSDNETISNSTYVGNLEIKILPKEGYFGGITKEKIHVVLKAGWTNEYELELDSLFLYTRTENFIEFKYMDPVISLNQQRNIEVQVKNNKYLFKPKKDKK